jgi:2-hydroxychromene-2-carboxylate isomerase
MSPPILIFNFDISCPFAYIASTRITALVTRTQCTISYRPVLLGAIYRATSAPQGAGGSASDVFNAAKRKVTSASMARTLKRYKTPYEAPARHPMKSVNALRMLYCVPDGNERRTLMEGLFRAYWVDGRDITDNQVLLDVARDYGITNLNMNCFADTQARKSLEDETEKAIQRGAFGVPGFWLPEANGGEGRFFWGQDRMHFVEATLLALTHGKKGWEEVGDLQSLMPRCIPLQLASPLTTRTKLEYWFDFSSPWAFLGYTQLARLQRQFGPNLEIVLKPFLLGILFREIGAPNMPMLAYSEAKRNYSQADHRDWVNWWNAVNVQEGKKDKEIAFYWADVFPIRTPTVLRVGIVEPGAVDVLCESSQLRVWYGILICALDRACWENNQDVSDDGVLGGVLTKAGYNGKELVAKANAPEIKSKLRQLTAEAKELGICGVPTYRVLREDRPGNGNWKNVGGIVWGQDETNVVEDLIAGWDLESSDALAEPRKGEREPKKVHAKL